MSLKTEYSVKQIPAWQTHEWILKKHYAHRLPSISYAFGLFDKENLLKGIATFGIPASYTLCEGICGKENKNRVLELNRLCLADSIFNIASYFINKCLALLPKPKILVSYADPNNGHHGYIYQATNWLYTGLSSREKIYTMESGEIVNTRRHIDEKGKILHTEYQLPKHRYVYFIGNKKEIQIMKTALKYNVMPYPKGNNNHYNASYQPATQISML